MKNNPSAMMGLYGSNELFCHTVRDTYRMKEDIDGEALTKAVNTAIKRYPYFSVKLVKHGDEVIHTVVPNDRPVVVADRTEPFTLYSKETNQHFFAVLYHEKEIYLDISHAFVDGTAIYEFAKTLLYYYIKEKNGMPLPAGVIRTLDTPVTDEEITDPYLNIPPLTEKPVGGRPKPVPAFRLSESGMVTDKNYAVFKLSVGEDVFMKYSRRNDGSPATMTAAFLARTIFRLHDNPGRPVRINLSLNQRPVLGTPKAHHSVVGNVVLEYPERVKNWDMHKLGTISRSMVMIQSDPANVLSGIHGMKKIIDGLYHIEDEGALKKACNRLFASAGTYTTAVVSYVGKSDFGVLDDYIESHYTYLDPYYCDISIEIAAVNGYFVYTFMQAFSDDVYVKALADEFRKEGIEAELGKAEPLIFPRTSI